MRFLGKAKIVKEEKRKVEYLRCDNCNSKIQKSYYEVTIGHNDWGNDSVDSIRFLDICEKCIKKYTSYYLSNQEGTEYINIKRQRDVDIGYYDEYDKLEDGLVELDKGE